MTKLAEPIGLCYVNNEDFWFKDEQMCKVYNKYNNRIGFASEIMVYNN